MLTGSSSLNLIYRGKQKRGFRLQGGRVWLVGGERRRMSLQGFSAPWQGPGFVDRSLYMSSDPDHLMYQVSSETSQVGTDHRLYVSGSSDHSRRSQAEEFVKVRPGPLPPAPLMPFLSTKSFPFCHCLSQESGFLDP